MGACHLAPSRTFSIGEITDKIAPREFSWSEKKVEMRFAERGASLQIHRLMSLSIPNKVTTSYKSKATCPKNQCSTISEAFMFVGQAVKSANRQEGSSRISFCVLSIMPSRFWFRNLEFGKLRPTIGSSNRADQFKTCLDPPFNEAEIQITRFPDFAFTKTFSRSKWNKQACQSQPIRT